MCLNPRILIIEDNPDDALSLCLALEESVPNVQLAVVNDQLGLVSYLRHIEQNSHQMPWLIFFDIDFPDSVDGAGVISQLQSYFLVSSRRSIPVIAMSSSASLADVRELQKAGANSYLIKSDNFRQLVADCRDITRHWFKTALLPPN
ncbi:response regulator [Spirosoma sp.]|uniref:response regulator n=1 Tax=Spirosoma sp. TaxID=1899569 RepID=UPI00261024B6|nr:response regulator [Spirosoma sp.]MCX6212903.1 response regulator [Spirosoma sp.]